MSLVSLTTPPRMDGAGLYSMLPALPFHWHQVVK
jgi:hypothetical protein